jgi:membrane-bound lytic murein transglycosylase A
MKPRYLILILLIVMLGGCIKKPSIPVLTPPAVPLATPLTLVTDGEMPLLADDLDAGSLDLAISGSLRYLDRGVADRYRFGDRDVSVTDIKESLLAFREILRSQEDPEKKMKKIREGFDLYRATGSDGKGAVVFTGYYAPVLDGSLHKTDRFQYPIYKPPEELATKMRAGKNNNAYYSRADIDSKKVLAGRNLEIAWVDDPIALFFLHIQGSGSIRLPDGKLIRVSFARHNGRSYKSIARYMVEKGYLSKNNMSNQAIKKYLKEHPDQQAEIFNYNERYIFFRIVEASTGALGVPVTGGRSIAVDPSVFPKGILAFIKLRKPIFDQDGKNKEWVQFSRFVLSQDEGDAIKGPGRIDLFCGEGEEAGRFASILKEKGDLYFLIRKRI